MIFLSDSALKYAVEICQEKTRYSVAIVVPSPRRREAMWYRITELLKDNNTVLYARWSMQTGHIGFKNNSSIDLLLASENSKGMAYNLVIADQDVDYDILMHVLMPQEKKDWLVYKRHQDKRSCSTDEESRRE